MTLKELTNIRTLASFIAIFLISLAGYVSFSEKSDAAEIYFFDIGQGDASMIVLPEDIQILIDGGPGSSILSKLEEVLPFHDQTIEYVILSHPHSDHITGLTHVLERYTVGLLIYNGVVREELSVFEDFQDLIEEKDIETLVMTEPLEIQFSERARMEFYYPDIELEKDFGDINASSIVHRFTYGGVNALFTGDIPVDVEEYLLEKGEDIQADILKVAHQGSRTSSHDEFVQAVSPQYSVIMVGGDNQYGHPHQKVLRTLDEYGGIILRTDKDGDIVFSTDGAHITYND